MAQNDMTQEEMERLYQAFAAQQGALQSPSGLPMPPQQSPSGLPMPPQQPQPSLPMPPQQPPSGLPMPSQQPQPSLPMPSQQPQQQERPYHPATRGLFPEGLHWLEPSAQALGDFGAGLGAAINSTAGIPISLYNLAMGKHGDKALPGAGKLWDQTTQLYRDEGLNPSSIPGVVGQNFIGLIPAARVASLAKAVPSVAAMAGGGLGSLMAPEGSGQQQDAAAWGQLAGAAMPMMANLGSRLAQSPKVYEAARNAANMLRSAAPEANVVGPALLTTGRSGIRGALARAVNTLDPFDSQRKYAARVFNTFNESIPQVNQTAAVGAFNERMKALKNVIRDGLSTPEQRAAGQWITLKGLLKDAIGGSHLDTPAITGAVNDIAMTPGHPLEIMPKTDEVLSAITNRALYSRGPQGTYDVPSKLSINNLWDARDSAIKYNMGGQTYYKDQAQHLLNAMDSDIDAAVNNAGGAYGQLYNQAKKAAAVLSAFRNDIFQDNIGANQFKGGVDKKVKAMLSFGKNSQDWTKQFIEGKPLPESVAQAIGPFADAVRQAIGPMPEEGAQQIKNVLARAMLSRPYNLNYNRAALGNDLDLHGIYQNLTNRELTGSRTSSILNRDWNNFVLGPAKATALENYAEANRGIMQRGLLNNIGDTGNALRSIGHATANAGLALAGLMGAGGVHGGLPAALATLGAGAISPAVSAALSSPRVAELVHQLSMMPRLPMALGAIPAIASQSAPQGGQ